MLATTTIDTMIPSISWPYSTVGLHNILHILMMSFGAWRQYNKLVDYCNQNQSKQVINHNLGNLSIELMVVIVKHKTFEKAAGASAYMLILKAIASKTVMEVTEHTITTATDLERISQQVQKVIEAGLRITISKVLLLFE